MVWSSGLGDGLWSRRVRDEVSWLCWRGMAMREQMAALLWKTRNWSFVRA